MKIGVNIRLFAIIIAFFAGQQVAIAQHEEHQQENHTPTKSEKYNPTPTVMHHIGNANEFHIVGDVVLPLPCILYNSENGKFSTFMSSSFEHGAKAVDGYVLDHGVVRKAVGLPEGDLSLEAAHGGHEGEHHGFVSHREVEHDGKKAEEAYVSYQGKEYKLEPASTLTNMTSWYDFSISKNVFSMILGFLLLIFLMRSVASAYKRKPNQAPTGFQNAMEVVITFLRDQVAIPAIGPKWEKYFPFILSLFFFILVNNLFGLIPFFPGSANVTGNISTTLVLAVFTFFVVNLSGNKHYWQHVFWMPGVPAAVKLILTPIEIVSLFVKPFTLLIRLFANITAGHIIILSLVSLIFVFGNAGQSVGGSALGSLIAVPFVFVMNILELFVAFLQAFIFALLASLYIGSAVEEHHHHEEHHEAAH